MIKKIIACSDVHIRAKDRLAETHEILTGFFKQIESEMEGYEKDEIRIVVAGDLFDNFVKVTNEGNMVLGWFLRHLNGLAKTIVIAGNHDYFKGNLEKLDTLTPLFSIGNYENVIYLDKELNYASGTYEDDNVVWCLYSTFSGFERPEITASKKKNPDHKHIGLFHGEVNGAKNDFGHVFDTGLEKSAFKGLDFVIAGHIHKRQELKYGNTKIVYCGSIIQQNFGENIQNHGYVVWNLKDNTYTYKDVNSMGYGYYIFSIDNIEDIDEDKEILKNFD